MADNTFYALCLIAAVLSILIIRVRWIVWKIEEHRSDIIWFCVRTKKPMDYANDISGIWMPWIIALEFWNWNFNRYVIDQEKCEEMQKFLNSELDKSELDMEDILSRIEQEDKNLDEQDK